MPTIKQKTAFKKTLENIGNQTTPAMGEVMLETGYSKSMAKNPQALIKSKGWQELLNEIDDGIITKTLYSILKSDDKRSSLTAIDMLLKLKDRYPTQKSSEMVLFGKIANMKQEDNQEDKL